MRTRNKVLWPLDFFGDDVKTALHDVFEAMPSVAGTGSIAVNVWEDEDAFHVEVEVPGLSAEDIDVSLEERRLTLKGGASSEQEDQKRDDENSVTWHRRERRSLSFQRIVTLPGDVKGDAIDAKLDRGLLHLTLPKADALKPRKIRINR